MPLGLMTLSDVSKCDAIKLNICKRIYKLPRSTPSAMIHQDRERAGLGLTKMHVMYAKLTSRQTGPATQALRQQLLADFHTGYHIIVGAATLLLTQPADLTTFNSMSHRLASSQWLLVSGGLFVTPQSVYFGLQQDTGGGKPTFDKCIAVQCCHINSVISMCTRISFIAALPCIHACSVLYHLCDLIPPCQVLLYKNLLNV